MTKTEPFVKVLPEELWSYEEIMAGVPDGCAYDLMEPLTGADLWRLPPGSRVYVVTDAAGKRVGPGVG